MTPFDTLAHIEQIKPLTDSIVQLIVAPERYIDYYAGQYLLLLNKGLELPYSIANAPLGSKHYELHIRHSRNNLATQHLLEQIRHTGILPLRAPFGECYLDRMDPLKPILFIAVGTGFAPINAMIEQLLASGEQRAFELIWGARSHSDLYLDEKVKKWQNHVHQFQYVSLLSRNSKQSLASVVRSRHQSRLNDWQMVISGSFDMVYHMRDELVALGVSPFDLYSDAFQFEDKV